MSRKTKNDNRQIPKPKDIVNEFEGFEIEEKFQFSDKVNEAFLNIIKKRILDDNRFSALPGYEFFRWVFYFDYYAYCERNRTEEAFRIIHHPSTPRIWIREKGAPMTFSIKCKNCTAWVIKRTEDAVVREYTILDRKFINSFKKKKELDFGLRTFYLARLQREKYYTYLRYNPSGRVYVISLDLCYSRRKKMSQLEIEYKWRDGGFKEKFRDMSSILDEFKIFTDILSFFGSKVVPTQLTKFSWLLKVNNDKGS